MIDANNLKSLLTALNFSQLGPRFIKTFAHTDGCLSVDFFQLELVYPEQQGLVINERQTCNFQANENFVVFECVHRLLEKGYKPEHIELEPRWKLGHGSSGGRADILVKDNDGKALLIIECKTAGREFDKAWRNTQQDGDQLFSYAQQTSEIQFLCLYASDMDSGGLGFTNHIIAHRDNKDYLKDNPQLKGFDQAKTVKERFYIWRDTYKQDYTTKGIFESNIQPYHIGKDKYTIDDLQRISPADHQKKYHEFATILRQHNVSGRENAFDKLVNLFLCKLVDETENKEELKFYWKGVAYDTHFDLLDRLQQLYQSGMKTFLGEDITYIEKSQVINALRFIKQDPDATQRAVWDLFVRQKFFTNNDFSFIDVHNEKLFYQNAEVLLKILQMWQDVRMTPDPGQTAHNQFLGDLFEGFLDQGVKQSEGQFFTPMPICRFILMSLPLETMIQNSKTPPRAIDYACGAGHFLNELAMQIAPFVDKYKGEDRQADFHKEIYGIEKEYRLSKVAKVSAFMYGQKDIRIIYGDALAAHEGIQEGSFDLLVANPPYSVRGFLETLPEAARDSFALSQTIDKLETNNSIETFFLERAKQLLKAGGVAALILPSSILSNGNTTYVKAREILLQYFDIIAIVELGSGTFGKTGTNTVTLFLRRKSTEPDTAEHWLNRVDEWFDADANQGVYQDAHLYQRYAEHIGVDPADYRSLLNRQPNDSLLKHEIFVQYRKAFDSSTEIINLNNQKGFKAKPKTEQEAELSRRFLGLVQKVERDKLYHFILAYTQPNPVLIVKSPADSKAQKQFLGYDWSSAKGNEGIKLLKDAQGYHQTLLFDETNRDNPIKINTKIVANYNGILTNLSGEMAEYASAARLVDMLDFSRIEFEKPILLNNKKAVKPQSKWPLHKLSDLVDIISGGTPDTGNPDYWSGDIPWLSVADFSSVVRFVESAEKTITESGLNNSSTKLLRQGDLIISARGTVGALAQLKKPMAFNQSCYGLTVKDNSSTSNDYLFHVLKREIQQFKAQAWGSKFDAITIKTFDDVYIPLPSQKVIQDQMVEECEALDNEECSAKMTLAESHKKIGEKVITMKDRGFELKPLHEIAEIKRGRFSHRPRNDPRFFDGPYPFIQTGDVVRAKGGKMAYTQTLNEEGLSVSKLFEPPVVLVTIAANIGDTAVLDFPACFTDSVVGLLPRPGMDARFLELMMRTHKQHLNDIAPQMAQKNINIEILKPIKIPVPPLAEQQRLVAEIAELEQAIADAQAVIDAAPAKKQAVLQKYL